MSLNVVILSGRLTSDPELKTTPNGVSVCSFTIAVERKYKQGEEKQADFINIVAWRATAEFIAKYFQKGSMIGIEGAIQTRRYQDKEGNNRTAFEIVASNVHFMESKKTEGNNYQDSPLVELQSNLEEFTEVTNDEDLPF